jgi:uncharacterized protein involved in cysteine biosynthesis
LLRVDLATIRFNIGDLEACGPLDGQQSHCEGTRSFRIISGVDEQGVIGVALLVVILLLAAGFLFMVISSVPLDAVKYIMANVKDFAGVMQRLIDFFIGIAMIVPF